MKIAMASPLKTGAATRHPWRLAVVAAIVAAPLAACAPEPPSRVFLISVDTLRADHIGVYGYRRATSPAIDALAEQGVLFEQSIAQFPQTTTSFASLFTGRYPTTTGMVLSASLELPERYETLPEWMQGQGYRTVAVVSNQLLQRRQGWGQGFDDYVECWWHARDGRKPEGLRAGIHAGRVNDLALSLLARHASAERLFAWIHYSDPHSPYVLQEGFENPFVGDPFYRGGGRVPRDVPLARRIGRHQDVKYYVAQYDANIRYVDTRIGELLARADELGLLRGALVIFTADHGESLGEHGSYFEHRLPQNNTLAVPLIFHRPGIVAAGVRLPFPVELVDLYPTLKDLIAPTSPAPVLEGRSLAPWLVPAVTAEPQEQPGYAFSEAAGSGPGQYQLAVQDGAWKLVARVSQRSGEDPAIESEDLYDLRKDPGETQDVGAANPSERRRLRQALAAWIDRRSEARLPGEPVGEPRGGLDPETRLALEQLGYLEPDPPD